MALFWANFTRIVVALLAVILTVGRIFNWVTQEEWYTAIGFLLAGHATASALLDGGAPKQP